MRDIILALIIFGSLPLILARPWVGIIMWSWVSFMNPHRLAWGFMYEMKVALLIGVATLIAWVLTQEDRKIPVNSISILMFVLLTWCGITTIFAINEEATTKYFQFSKVILMTFVAMSLMKKPEMQRYLVWITVASIGFFSVKGGIFTLMTGGGSRVFGPPDTFITDNNALALATLMIVPLMIYLAQTTTNRWIKYGMYACALFSLTSVVGSYSRGGFLGMGTIAVVLWWRSKNKIITGTLAAMTIVIGLAAVPQQWLERMDTIQNYEQDRSALGRLEMWDHAVRVANDRPIIGGGFRIFADGPTFERLSPEISIRRSVHSIYFEMLATQGYIGLTLFLLLGAAGLLTARKIKNLTKDKPHLKHEFMFANMIQISLIAYAVSGLFLNLATYDMYYTLLALTSLSYYNVSAKLKQKEPATAAPAEEEVQPATTQPKSPRWAGGRSFLRAPSR